jgi:5-methylcytosine-specific restriction endonuclease McrA
MPTSIVSTRRYIEWRAEKKATWKAVNAPCALCGQRTIEYDAPANTPLAFEMDHRISRKRRPDLAMVDSNVQPSHHSCNRRKSSGDAPLDLGPMDEQW